MVRTTNCEAAHRPLGGGAVRPPDAGTAYVPTTLPADGWGAAVQPVGAASSLKTWGVAFQEEFTSALNTNFWNTSWFSGGSTNGSVTSPANVAVTGGDAVLTLASANCGAMITANPADTATTGFQFTYGDDYYYDGVLVDFFTTSNDNNLHHLMFDVGGETFGGPSILRTASQVKVDHVRVWI